VVAVVPVAAVSIMFGTCHGLVVVVVDVVLVVDVDTVVEAVTSGVHSCVPAVSRLPVIVAPTPPPAPLSVPVVSVDAVSVPVEAEAPPPEPKTRPPDAG
jgi:hypothetical protein